MIRDYLRAGYPALFITTQEPFRTQEKILCENARFFAWNCISGITEADTHKAVETTTDPIEAIKWLQQQDTVLIAHNLHLFFDSVEVIQAIINGVHLWKSIGACLVVTAPTCKLPPEIEKLFHLIDMPLPTEEELHAIQSSIAESMEGIEVNRQSVVAAKGLTEFEAETAFALSLIKKAQFSQEIVTQAKAQMIKKSGFMEFWPPVSIDQVGGLDPLKQYVQNRVCAFEPGCDKPRPKGILLVGIPGTGKSLTAKATASIFSWPLIRMDISGLKGGIVGETEKNVRIATKTVDAFGESVLWLDEVEKALAGSRSSGETDGGVTSGLLGHLLTWMQETETPVFIVATANNISQLPPELIRRFDDVFFVDAPTAEEREQILNIMNARYPAAQLPVTPGFVSSLEGYTGAEIEKIAKASIFDGLESAMANTIPLFRTMKDEIQWLKSWAETKARKANRTVETVAGTRRVQIGR